MAAKKPGRPGYPLSISAVDEHIFKLVTGDLTSDGVQYSAVATTGATSVAGTPFTYTLDNGLKGTLLELDLGLSIEFRGTSTTVDPQFCWKGRHSGAAAWVDLFATVTAANPGTAFLGTTYSGYGTIAANLGSVPLELCLVTQANEGTAGVFKVKNSSYAKVKYKPV